MITYIKQDITELDRGFILHGVNCQGVMGSGIALAIRNKWPQVYEQYKIKCAAFQEDQQQLLGKVQFVDVDPDTPLVIANGFTQINFGKDHQRYADPWAIKKCLLQTVDIVRLFYEDVPIYMPMVGCGLGGLNWKLDVQPIVEHVHDLMSSSEMFPSIKPVQIYICDL